MISRAQFQLVLYQSVVISLPGNQFIVRTLFGYFSFFQHHYLVGVFHRAQAMGNNDHCLVLEELLQIALYHLFIVRVEGIGRFVEEQIVGIAIDGARYQDTLFLSLAQSLSRVAYFGVIL